MVDIVEVSGQLIDAYNAKDFDAMATFIAEDIDFAHFNRDFNLCNRDALLDVLKQFAQTCVPNRHFEKPERVFAVGDKVVREAYYVGTAAIDLPGFGAAGDAFRLKFCSVMRFSDDGMLLEWKDLCLVVKSA